MGIMKTFFYWVLLTVLSGCALTTDRIAIGYEPMEGVQILEKAEEVPVQIVVVDQREIKDEVGRKKNGYGMKLAPIVSENDIGDLVKLALSQELINRGFKLSDHENLSILIDVELSRFYNRFKLGFWSAKSQAVATLNVKVQNQEGVVSFSQRIEGHGERPFIMLMNGQNAKQALERALKNAIEQLVEEKAFLDAILNNYRLQEPVQLNLSFRCTPDLFALILSITSNITSKIS